MRLIASTVFHSESGAPLKLVTIDHVAVGPEKKKLGVGHHAVLADMEAATVARFARDHGCAFYCLKAVSDTMGEVMPDFSRYTDNRGHLRLSALLAHVAIRPQYWPGLARMGRNGSRGAVALAQAARITVVPMGMSRTNSGRGVFSQNVVGGLALVRVPARFSHPLQFSSR